LGFPVMVFLGDRPNPTRPLSRRHNERRREAARPNLPPNETPRISSERHARECGPTMGPPPGAPGRKQKSRSIFSLGSSPEDLRFRGADSQGRMISAALLSPTKGPEVGDVSSVWQAALRPVTYAPHSAQALRDRRPSQRALDHKAAVGTRGRPRVGRGRICPPRPRHVTASRSGSLRRTLRPDRGPRPGPAPTLASSSRPSSR